MVNKVFVFLVNMRLGFKAPKLLQTINALACGIERMIALG